MLIKSFSERKVVCFGSYVLLVYIDLLVVESTRLVKGWLSLLSVLSLLAKLVQ